MQAQRDQQIMLQAMQNSARLQSQQLAINAQKQMTEFRAFVDQEADKRKYAWQVERDDLMRRHDLDMVEAKTQQLVDLQQQKELQRINQLESQTQSVENMFHAGKISEEERGAALLKIEADYYRQLQAKDPLKDAAAKAIEGRDKLTGKDRTTAPQNIDPVQESSSRTALLNMAIQSGDTRLANLASEGSYAEVLNALKTPKQRNVEQLTAMRSNYLTNVMPSLKPADQVKLKGILAAGKNEQIAKAYNEVLKDMQGKLTGKVSGTPEEIVNIGYQTLAEMRRSNNEF